MSEAVDLSQIKDGDPLSREELEQLMQPGEEEQAESGTDLMTELQVACAGGLKIVTVPATIELKDKRKFLVEDFRAWGWSPFGVFAIGFFSDDTKEDIERGQRYRVFNGDEVANIELEAETFEKALADAKAAEAEDESS